MPRGNHPFSSFLLSSPLLLALGPVGCDEVGSSLTTETSKLDATEQLASGASSLTAPITSDARAKTGAAPLASDRDEYVAIGPDDVDRFGGQFGFGLGERVPRATRDAQRALIERINALYQEWRESGRAPEEFLRLHEPELRGLSRGFVGLEVEPPQSRAKRAGGTPFSPVKDLADRPPPPLEVFDSGLHPCDRPTPSTMPLVNCSADRAAVLNGAKDNAAYLVWRTLWLLDRILEEDDATAALLWRDGWTADDYDGDNHQLQNWFGDFDRSRAEGLRGAFQALWGRWLGPGADGTYENSVGVSVESALVCYVPPTWLEIVGWVLSGQIWQFFNPCFTGGGSAHHLYASGPQFCGDFFANGGNDLQNGASLIHELLHRVRIDGDLIQDTHFGACGYDDGDDGLPKCYDTDEVLNLAENFPDIAILNNENYEFFSIWYVNHWLTGGCMNPDVCAEVDDTHPDCAPPPPPPPPPDYSDCEDPTDPTFWGVQGCPCKNTTAVTTDDIYLDGGGPDGDGSYVSHGVGGPGQFCFGADVVCGILPGADPNSANDDFSICKACGDDPNDTRVGCPCQTDTDCEGFESGLACWGSEASGWGPSAGGKCLPDGSAPNQEWHEEHPWFCLDNCESMALGADIFGCYYDQYLGGLGQAEHGECITLSNGCGPDLLVGQCEVENNQQCTDGGDCVDECNFTEDCPAKGFPDWYVCDSAGDGGFEPGHCVPPECANSNSPYCSLFR